jgi:sporulation protein YlmC with PRC-barrel domain
MWKYLMALGALAFALSAAPAIAQQTPTEEPPAASESVPQPDQSAPLGDLTGLEVYSSDGQKIGTVAKSEANAQGEVESIQVDIGGFLGIGQKTVEIGADQFTQVGDRVELTLSADAAAELPEAMAR